MKGYILESGGEMSAKFIWKQVDEDCWHCWAIKPVDKEWSVFKRRGNWSSEGVIREKLISNSHDFEELTEEEVFALFL